VSYPPPYDPQQPPPYTPGPPQQYSPAPQYGAPYPQQPAPPLPPQPPKSKATKTVLITVGSLVGVVLVICLIGAIATAGDSGDKAKVKSPAATQAAGKKAAKTTDATKDTDEQKQPDTYNVALGSTITITGDDGARSEGTIRSVKTYKKACNSFSPEPENGEFVVVDVLVEQTKGTGSVNPLDFTFVGADGTTANGISAAFSGCDKPSLSSTNSLHAGQKRAGKIAFDASSGKGTVEWAPGGLGADTVGSWKVG
jgi:hypothetical protein